jgi:hypothetical protein
VADDRQQIIDEFDELVNMTPKELKEWLQTEESKSVGQSDDGASPRGTSRAGRSSRSSARTSPTTRTMTWNRGDL